MLAKHLTHIGVARGFGASGLDVVHVHLHDRHGKIRAQHHLTLIGVLGDKGTAANVFAVEVQQRFGRLQKVRFHRRGTGVFERL
ncbi:hypothetical protein PM04_05430 [Thalassobacter sp. 16PALIMAR09]|nr:hypothetical protein PM04_05430 [Thalassobacter sp. 16PALIMAR09]